MAVKSNKPITTPPQDTSVNQPINWQEPDRSDNKKAVNVLNENKYTFCRNSYTGSGGYRTGYYLVPHALETTYPERRQLASYNNYIQPIVNAMVDPVFSKEIKRDVSGSGKALYESFLQDVDGCGNDINTFMSTVAKMANLNGVEFIVMDSTPFSGTVDEQIRDRAFPYVYNVGADMILDYNVYGDIKSRYVYIRAEDVIVEKVSYKAATKWTTTTSQVVYWKDDKWVEYGEPTEHNLGVIPIIAVYSTPQTADFLVEPRLYDLCKMNWFVYNLDSERREVYRKQGFSLLAIQTDIAGGEIGMKVGTGNALFIPSTVSNMPQYVSPNPDVARGLLEESKSVIERIYQIAQQNGVTAVQQADSGIAKEWDFQAHAHVLNNTSMFCEDAEMKLSKLFGKYIEKDIVYEVEYPSNFEPRSKALDIDTLMKAFDMNISPSANKEISLAVFDILFPKIEKERRLQIENELTNITPASDGGV